MCHLKFAVPSGSSHSSPEYFGWVVLVVLAFAMKGSHLINALKLVKVFQRRARAIQAQVAVCAPHVGQYSGYGRATVLTLWFLWHVSSPSSFAFWPLWLSVLVCNSALHQQSDLRLPALWAASFFNLRFMVQDATVVVAIRFALGFRVIHKGLVANLSVTSEPYSSPPWLIPLSFRHTMPNPFSLSSAAERTSGQDSGHAK